MYTSTVLYEECVLSFQNVSGRSQMNMIRKQNTMRSVCFHSDTERKKTPLGEKIIHKRNSRDILYAHINEGQAGKLSIVFGNHLHSYSRVHSSPSHSPALHCSTVITRIDLGRRLPHQLNLAKSVTQNPVFDIEAHIRTFISHFSTIPIITVHSHSFGLCQ